MLLVLLVHGLHLRPPLLARVRRRHLRRGQGRQRQAHASVVARGALVVALVVLALRRLVPVVGRWGVLGILLVVLVAGLLGRRRRRRRLLLRGRRLAAVVLLLERWLVVHRVRRVAVRVRMLPVLRMKRGAVQRGAVLTDLHRAVSYGITKGSRPPPGLVVTSTRELGERRGGECRGHVPQLPRGGPRCGPR